MVVVFFVFVSFFLFLLFVFILTLGVHILLKGGIFFVGRAVESRTPHFVKVSHFFLPVLDDHPVFSLHKLVAVRGGSCKCGCYLSPCCWEDICAAGDNSSRGGRGQGGGGVRINIHQLACEKPQTQPRTPPSRPRTNLEAAWGGGARVDQKEFIYIYIYKNVV